MGQSIGRAPARGALYAADINDGIITSAHIATDTVVAADIADNAVTLAKMAGGTDGQIITYDASGNPVAVGPGTAGQVLKSAGAGAPPVFGTGFDADAAQVFNESGADVDFRVEGGSNPNAIFVDGAGPRVYMGHNVGLDLAGAGHRLQCHSIVDDNTNGIAISHWSGANSTRAHIAFAKSLGSSIGTYTAVTDGRQLGAIEWYGADGDSFELGAQIQAEAAQTFSGTARGTEITFHTVDNSTTTLDERMRIAHNGSVGINTTGAMFGGLNVREGGNNGGSNVTSNAVAVYTNNKSVGVHLWHYGLRALSQTLEGTALDANQKIMIDARGTGAVLLNTETGGSVGIGTTSPASYDGEADNLVVFGTGHTGITIASSDTNARTKIHFADGTGGSSYRGQIEYAHSDDYMRFLTAAGERMKIHSDGNVTAPGQSCFEARDSRHMTSSGNQNFGNNAHYNPTGDFNASNYRFTAPVTGMYYFHWRVNRTYNVTQYFYKNGSQVSGAENNTADVSWHQAAISTIISLAENDYVTCTLNNPSGSGWNGGHWDSFTGHLIG